MAKITRVFASGSLGNLVFYEWKGKLVVRTRPARVRQSAGTVNESSLFGKAKTISRILRQGLAPVLGNPADRQAMYILDAALRQWLKKESLTEEAATTPLEYLDLRKNTSFQAMFRKPVASNWSPARKLMVTIPALELPRDIVAPPDTTEVCLKLALAGCRLRDFSTLPGSSTEIQMNYESGNLPARELELEFEPEPGSIYVFAAGLQYKREGRQEGKALGEEWTPVAIIDSGYFETRP